MHESFRLSELPGPVGVVTFDVPGKKVNTLSRTVRDELDQLLRELEQRTDFIGLLFQSGKPGQFIAGADLKELAALAHEPPERTQEFLEQGHRLLNRLSQLPYPTVALVAGPAYGGGTELSLACDERIATVSAQFCLPETKLGMIPGWGGTQRLPRVVELSQSLEMICKNETVSGESAVRLGLATSTSPAETLSEAGRQWIEKIRAGDVWKSQRHARQQPLSITPETLEQSLRVHEQTIDEQLAKGAMAAAAHAGCRAALRAIREGILLPLAEGLELEEKVAATVIGSAGAAGLINDFFSTRSAPGGKGS